MRVALAIFIALPLLGGCISVDRGPLEGGDVDGSPLTGDADGSASGDDITDDVPQDAVSDPGTADTPAPDTPVEPDAPVQPDTPTPDAVVPDTQGPDVPPTEDVEEDTEPPALCPGLTSAEVEIVGGQRYARFGETVEIAGTVTGTADVDMAITVDPPEMEPFLEEQGDGIATFGVDDVDLDFQTTEVTFHFESVVGRCFVDRTVSLKVLGNVWIADRDNHVVEVFRSDGSYIMQGVPSTYLETPWSLTQLDGERFMVGSRYTGGAPIYTFDAEKVGGFDEDDEMGQYLWSVDGAYSALVHEPDEKVWVGGVRGQLLVFEPDGSYVETLYLDNYNLTVEDMWQLPDGNVVLLDDSSLDWEMTLVDDEAEEIGPWGDNGGSELKLVIETGTAAPDGDYVVAGRMGTGSSAKGFLARLKSGGQMLDHSDPLELWPRYGLTAFGDEFLVSTDDDRVVMLDAGLEVVDDDWTGDKDVSWTAIMIAGGN
ncbi:MAG: hypothetical protein ACQEXJ_24600 [Myxococcota bacterium]